MSEKVKIVALSGSTRVGSLNKKLVKASIPFLEELGAEVQYIDLKEFELPIYDGDLESVQGIPPMVRKLKDVFISADGFLISTPEYNGYFSGVFKNAIDWLSRPVEGYPPFECFEHKTAGLLAASPGGMGGIRALLQVRQLLSGIKVLVVPDQFGLANAGKAFQDDLTFTESKTAENVKKVCASLVQTTQALKK